MPKAVSNRISSYTIFSIAFVCLHTEKLASKHKGYAFMCLDRNRRKELTYLQNCKGIVSSFDIGRDTTIGIGTCQHYHMAVVEVLNRVPHP